jgi:hypothetical protein
VNPVEALLAVTVTPGTAAFWASVIRPWMFPVVCCAAADVAVRANAPTAIIATMILFITD